MRNIIINVKTKGTKKDYAIWILCNILMIVFTIGMVYYYFNLYNKKEVPQENTKPVTAAEKLNSLNNENNEGKKHCVGKLKAMCTGAITCPGGMGNGVCEHGEKKLHVIPCEHGEKTSHTYFTSCEHGMNEEHWY